MLQPEETKVYTSTTKTDFKSLVAGDTSATISIDGNILTPSPFVTLSVQKQELHGYVLGGFIKLNISGVVYSESFGAGVPDIVSKLNILRDNNECVNIVIECDGTQLIDGYGKIVELNIDQGEQPTWNNVIPYTFGIELYSNFGNWTVKKSQELKSMYNITDDDMVKDINESITLNYANSATAGDFVPGWGNIATESHITLSFDITITGKFFCENIDLTYTDGLEVAEKIMLYRIDSLRGGNWTRPGGTQTYADIQSYIGGSSYLETNNVRVDPINGSINVSGNIVYRPSGCSFPNAFIQLNVESQTAAENHLEKTITITGTVTGLTNRPFTGIMTNSEFHNADTDRVEAADGVYGSLNFLSIALAHLDIEVDEPCMGSLDLCAESSERVCSGYAVISKTRTKNYHDGSVSFTAIVSNKKYCNLPGFMYYNTEIVEDYGHQQIVIHNVVGRGYPLIQHINCDTPQKRTVTVTGQLDQDKTCTSVDYDTLKSCVDDSCYNYIPDNIGGGIWYQTADTYSFAKNGSFRCIREFTYSDC